MSIHSRWLAWRDRMLASPAFHRFAARFALTRPMARREARALFDLMAGFVYSQVLYACVKLDVFSLLSRGVMTTAELENALRLTNEATHRLLWAAESLRLLESRGPDQWGLGMLGGVMVNNQAIAALVEHHASLYADLRDPVALLRGETDPSLARYWPYAGEGGPRAPSELTDEQVAAYSALMSASQPLVAREILAHYDFSRHSHLLDVGGGEGTFLLEAGRAHPHLQLSLFDLPAVAHRAREKFSREFNGRAVAHGGSFFETPLPQGADVATLIRVLYDHDDDRAQAILNAVGRALSPGATLVVAEPMSGTPGAEPMGAAYFGFYLLAMGKGKSRTPDALAQMMRRAGFGPPKLMANDLPLQVRILVSLRSAT